MAKNKGNSAATEKAAEEDKNVNVEENEAGSENIENLKEPEVVNGASEKTDEPMTTVGDEAANGAEGEKTADDEKSEEKKDQKEEKKKGKPKKKKSKKNKKKQNQVDKKPDDKKLEVSVGAKNVGAKNVGAKNDLAGLIFMCNSKTKQDCFRYHVFGLPKNQKDVVEKVSKGMKLFLYDFELRLMYGIYKAKGRGGLDLERNAFRSTERPFPAQVRFSIHRDCLPLSEDEFKVAIKDNYYGKNKKKFKFELSGQQVKNLCRLFRPIRRDGLVGRDVGYASSRKEERGVSYVESVPRPHLLIPERAQQYPPLAEGPYPLQASDPYRSVYDRRPLPMYEPPALGNGLPSDLDYQRESLYDRVRRERMLEESAYLDNIRRGYTPREVDYGDSYLSRDPLRGADVYSMRSADVYPSLTRPSSIYRY
uniref:TSA: Wollemia nobilis Ref_Wollemi_Transcript_8439_1825 transcribed RNA sequence n=1 Tax=Wollemia nobilis TaxID=56998 RepID=A0A0C9S992_9CONI